MTISANIENARWVGRFRRTLPMSRSHLLPSELFAFQSTGRCSRRKTIHFSISSLSLLKILAVLKFKH